jgi:hypothetical protein
MSETYVRPQGHNRIQPRNISRVGRYPRGRDGERLYTKCMLRVANVDLVVPMSYAAIFFTRTDYRVV